MVGGAGENLRQSGQTGSTEKVILRNDVKQVRQLVTGILGKQASRKKEQPAQRPQVGACVVRVKGPGQESSSERKGGRCIMTVT